MPQFRDGQDREWSIKITSWEVRVVKEKVGVLLTELLEEKCQFLTELYRDPVLLVDVLWAVLEDQATKVGVTLREFAAAIAGDPLAAARGALIEGIIDFFDDPETRAGVRDVLRKINQIGQRMQSEALTAINNLQPDSVARLIMSSSLNTPVFAGSSPGGSL